MAKDPQLITPMEKLEALGSFEGRQILGVGIEIPSAAGGFREALVVDPVLLHTGETVFVVIETRVGKVRFDPIADVEGYRRVHVLETVASTIVDREIVEKQLEAQQARIDEVKGLQRLNFDDGEGDEDDADAAARRAHMAGNHAEERKEDICPLCRAEVDAEHEEAEGDAATGPEL